MGIPNTPYALGVSVPEGLNTFSGKVDISLMGKEERIDVTHFLDHPNESVRKWKLNPNWHYCKFIRTEKSFENPEDLLIHFLRAIQSSTTNWGWKNTGVGITKAVRHSARQRHLDEEIYECKLYICNIQ
jgi:hypothetical protein